MKNIISLILVATITLLSPFTFAKGFGGGRSGGGFGGSRSSSFGGSRSGGSSYGGSRSSSVSKPSNSSSFGGNRSTRNGPAPIVRNSGGNSSTSSRSNYGTSHTVNVYHNYGYGGYYGSPYYGGGGFFHGFMWGQFFNRPQIVYVGGQQYISGPNGQPMLDEQGQPLPYQSNPLMTALAVMAWLLIIGFIVFLIYILNRRYNENN